MNIKDVRTERERRTFANAVAVILVLAVVSLLLELRSGSDLVDLVYSFGTFAGILGVAVFRFRARSSDRSAREKLLITAIWNRLTGLVARLLPGRADPPGASASAAPESAPPAVSLLKPHKERRGT